MNGQEQIKYCPAWQEFVDYHEIHLPESLKIHKKGFVKG